MGKAHFIEHENKKILILDFSMATEDSIRKTMEEGKKLIITQPPNSVLTLSDVSNTRFNKEIINAFKEYTQFNKPYVKAAAVVGVEGLIKIAFDAVNKFSQRDLRTFKTKEEALDWLIKQ